MSGTKRTIRLKPMCAAMRNAAGPLGIGLASLVFAQGGVSADRDPAAWDCRMGADGRSWQCYKDGELVQDPAAPADSSAFPPDPAPPAPAPVSPQTQDTGAATPATPEPLPAPVPAPPVSAAPPPAAAYPAPTATAQKTAPPVTGSVQPAPQAPQVETSKAVEARAAESATPLPAAPDQPSLTTAAQQPGVDETTMPADQATLQAFDDSPMPDVLGTAESEAQAINAQEAAKAAGEPISAGTPALIPISGNIDEGIDWDSCRSVAGASNVRLEQDAAGSKAPIEVSADGAVATFTPQRAVFSGNVRLVQGDMQMSADELIVNRESGDVDASGDVVLNHPDIRIAGSAASYQMETGLGQVEQADYRIIPMRARGAADHAEMLGDGQSRYRNISYTTCRPGKSDWLLTAETLELDQVEGLGTADHAKLRFFDVPVMYAPTFTFPIDDRRRSGLLIPSAGFGENTGFDLSVPYYLNLAPNYDLTLTPRVMSKRGVMLGGEFRFLTEITEGTLAAEFLPNDSEYKGGSDDRGAVSVRTISRFNPRTNAQVRLNYVTDDDYLTDLGNSLVATSATHLERAGELRYAGNTWNLLGRLQYYQTIDEDIAPTNRPYSRMPQLLMTLEDPDGFSGTTYHLGAEYVNFLRSDSMEGHRYAMAPGISLPLRETWGYVEPKVGVRYVGYQLNDEDPGIDDSASTLTGMFSLDSGLYFDRQSSLFGNATTHTLEPRLYYLYVPEEDQDDQPVFDTGLFDFNFDNIFRENRFNGLDRIGDANQLTLALTSRMLADESGVELLRASVGQIMYFEDREVTLPKQTVQDDSSSAIVAELAAQLGGGWFTRGGFQWDPHDGNGNFDQGLAQLGYRDNDNRVFSAAYRLRDDVTEQTDLAIFWPVNDQFSLIGRHNYSLQENRLLEGIAGVEYGRCCWRLRFIASTVTDDTGDNRNLSFMVQLELNGLGRFGNDIDETLERGIYGYTTD